MKTTSFFCLIILIFIFIPKNIRAEAKILINEFLIDPQPQMVEVYNSSSESANISDWYIDDNGGTTYFTIPQDTIIYPNSCLVFSGDFNLNKSSTDTIRLFNNSSPPTTINAQLIDSYTYKHSPGPNVSYIRQPDVSNQWTTASASLGEFNSTNLSCIINPTTSPSPVILPTLINIVSTDSPTPTTIVSYDNIYISEIMVNPNSEESEWIEIYNDNDYSVSLQDWLIDDIINAGSNPKSFAIDISPKNYAVIELSSAMFNNSGDSVRLLDDKQNCIDSFQFENSTSGLSYGRLSWNEESFCLQISSKNRVNNQCYQISPTTDIALIKTPAFFTPIPRRNYGKTVVSYNEPNKQQPFLNNHATYSSSNNILGTNTNKFIEHNNNRSLIAVNNLTTVSFVYSLLTIVSVFSKIKNAF